MRGTGHALCNFGARVGAFLSPYFVDTVKPIAVVGVVLGIVNIIIAISASFTPETAGKLSVTILIVILSHFNLTVGSTMGSMIVSETTSPLSEQNDVKNDLYVSPIHDEKFVTPLGSGNELVNNAVSI
jgi:hypothetical protein